MNVSVKRRIIDTVRRLIVLLADVPALRPSDIRVLTLDDADPVAVTLLLGGRARPLDQLTAGRPADPGQILKTWTAARARLLASSGTWPGPRWASTA